MSTLGYYIQEKSQNPFSGGTIISALNMASDETGAWCFVLHHMQLGFNTWMYEVNLSLILCNSCFPVFSLGLLSLNKTCFNGLNATYM